jgi:hypothetical protein
MNAQLTALLELGVYEKFIPIPDAALIGRHKG